MDVHTKWPTMLVVTLVGCAAFAVNAAGAVRQDTFSEEHGENLRDGLMNFAEKTLFYKEIEAEVDKSAQTQARRTDDSKTAENLMDQIIGHLEDVSKVTSELIAEELGTGSDVRVQKLLLCNETEEGLTDNYKFRAKVDLGKACLLHTNTTESVSSHPGHLSTNLLGRLRGNSFDNTLPFVRWHYVALTSGELINYPAYRELAPPVNPLLRPWFAGAVSHTVPRLVVIAVDANRLSDENRARSLRIVESIVATLLPTDKVAVVKYGRRTRGPTKVCYRDTMVRATGMNTAYLVNTFLKDTSDHRDYSGYYDYADLVSVSFGYLDEERKAHVEMYERSKPAVVLIMNEYEPVLSYTDATNIGRLGFSVGNNTELLMVSPLANSEADYVSFGWNVSEAFGDATLVQPIVISSEDVEDIAVQVYRSGKSDTWMIPDDDTGASSVIIPPYVDAYGWGLTLSVCQRIIQPGTREIVGVTCVDLDWAVLFEGLATLSEQKGAQPVNLRESAHYSFLTMNRPEGRLTLYHPLMPSEPENEAGPVYIDHLEPQLNFSNLPESFASSSVRYIPQGVIALEGVNAVKVTSNYHVSTKSLESFNTSLTVVVVTAQTVGNVSELEDIDNTHATMLYHRFDLYNTAQKPKLCRYLNRSASKGESAVQFSPSAFIIPSEYRFNKETFADVNIYSIDIKKSSGTERLLPSVGDQIELTSILNKLYLSSSSNQFNSNIVWQYVATTTGVFRSYPGTRLPHGYDALKRPWFRRAVSHGTDLVFSVPYDDASGSGWVCSLTKAYRAPDGTLLGVLAVDMAVIAVRQLVVESIPTCNKSGVDCMLLDTSGFIIVHEKYIIAVENGQPITNSHITNQDPSIARELIRQGVMVQEGCRDVFSSVRRTYWRVKLTKPYRSGDGSFTVQNINGTNVMLIMKREGRRDDLECPCPSLGGQCSLSVPRFFGSWLDTCHCPCSSGDVYSRCTGNIIPSPDGKETTSGSDEVLCPGEIGDPSGATIEEPEAADLEPCFNDVCQSRGDRSNCLASAGCNWCYRHNNGEEHEFPYCNVSSGCIFGITDRICPESDLVCRGTEEPIFEETDYEAVIIPIVLICVVTIVPFIAFLVVRQVLHTRRPAVIKLAQNQTGGTTGMSGDGEVALTTFPRAEKEPGKGTESRNLKMASGDYVHMISSQTQVQGDHSGSGTFGGGHSADGRISLPYEMPTSTLTKPNMRKISLGDTGSPTATLPSTSPMMNRSEAGGIARSPMMNRPEAGASPNFSPRSPPSPFAQHDRTKLPVPSAGPSKGIPRANIVSGIDFAPEFSPDYEVLQQ